MGAKHGKGFSPNKGKKSGEKSPAKNGQPENLDYVEGVVCKNDEIKENEMKLLPLGEDGGKILLIKQDGELHAIGSKCTHYGALLHTGALGKGRVRCPWHGACFNIKNGDIEDYPGLDSLPCYNVSVDSEGGVKVRAKRTDLETNKRTKQMCAYKSENKKTVVIAGGGPSAATCAETLRQEGFEGRIVMVCKESALPYDRPKVSKAMDVGVNKILLRSQLLYDENNIEILLGTSAIGLDTNQKTVKLSNNEDLGYDYLYVATGSQPRKPDMPGADLSNIFVLGNFTDGGNIVASLSPEKHVVCLGFGFVGMEVAAFCVGKCASVTLIGRDSAPFKAVFGEEIGTRIKEDFETKGVRFILNNSIAKFLPKEDGKTIGQVELLDGTIVDSDIAIVGIGATLNTEWLKETQIQLQSNGSLTTDREKKISIEFKVKVEVQEAQLPESIPQRDDVVMDKVEMRKNGTVLVNKFLKTNIENVYAGGDVAFAPVYSSGDMPSSIGHYALAHYHGKIAAKNIAGKETPLKAVPFFWTMLFGKSYRYAGHGRATGSKIVGDGLKFFSYYFKDGKVIAMGSCQRDPIVADFANLLYEGRELTQEEVERDPLAWMPNKPKDLLPAVSQS